MGPTPGLMQLRVIAEHLEGFLAPEVASVIVYEALEPFGGEVPQGEDLGRLVRESLYDLLTARIGEDQAFDVTQQIAMVLGLRETPAGERRRSSVPSPDDRRSDFPTAELAVSYDAVNVAVVAGGPGMERRLFASVGPLVTAVPVRNLDTLPKLVQELRPHLVLVDATDPVDSAARVAGSLDAISQAHVTVLWASDQPWGRAVLEHLGEQRARLTTLDRREGVEPLLDLVRSRARPEHEAPRPGSGSPSGVPLARITKK